MHRPSRSQSIKFQRHLSASQRIPVHMHSSADYLSGSELDIYHLSTLYYIELKMWICNCSDNQGHKDLKPRTETVERNENENWKPHPTMQLRSWGACCLPAQAMWSFNFRKQEAFFAYRSISSYTGELIKWLVVHACMHVRHICNLPSENPGYEPGVALLQAHILPLQYGTNSPHSAFVSREHFTLPPRLTTGKVWYNQVSC